MVRNRRAGEGRDLDDLADVEMFARFERQQDALAMLVAKGDKDLGGVAPGVGDGFGVVRVHNYILRYIVLFVKRVVEIFCRGQLVTVISAFEWGFNVRH